MNFEEINEHLIHFEKVQSNIDEVFRNQPNRRLLKKEVESILEGFQDYLKRNGFGGLEIQLIMNKLRFNKVLIN